jgi:putative phage-type endonuclease
MNAIRSGRGFLAALSAGAAYMVATPIALAIPALTVEASLNGLTGRLARGDGADLFNLLEDHQAAAAEERLPYKAYEKFDAKWFQRQRCFGRRIPDVLRHRPEDLELGFRDSSEVDRLRCKTWERCEPGEDIDRHSFAPPISEVAQRAPARRRTASPAISVVIREPTEDAMSGNPKRNWNKTDRRDFIGGSDARIIMGQDEKALIRLWQEKRGEVGPEDLSTNLIVQLGLVTEDLNRQWYERNTGNAIKDVQCRVKHPVIRWMAATLDGVVKQTAAVYEAKFMLPWSFSEEFAAEKYMAQLQHNMWVTNARMAALSVITGGGKWVEISIAADQLYQHLLLTAEKKFWRCVSFGEPPRLFGVEPPRPRIEAVRIVDMGQSNSWAEFAIMFRSTRSAFLEHEKAKTELKGLMPEDAKEAFGHGIRAKRSKSGAVSFEALDVEAEDAPVQ